MTKRILVECDWCGNSKTFNSSKFIIISKKGLVCIVCGTTSYNYYRLGEPTCPI